MHNQTHKEVPRLEHKTEVSEYRELLDLALYAFNAIPNQRIYDGNASRTYSIGLVK